MIGFALVVMLAAPPGDAKLPLKGARPMTQAEEEARAIKEWESKAARDIQVPDAGTVEPFHWRLTNILRETPIEGIQVVNDTPVKLHSVVVKGRLEDVVEEIYVHFLRSGLYAIPLEKQAQPFRQLQVTALDQQRAISYTAFVDALPDGTCMVMLGEANIAASTQAGLMRKAQKIAADQDFAPLMAQAMGPTRVSIEGMKTLSFQLRDSEAAVRKFYREELKKAGYSESEPDLFQKKTEEIQLSMSRNKEVLSVLLTSRARADDRLRVGP